MEKNLNDARILISNDCKSLLPYRYRNRNKKNLAFFVFPVSLFKVSLPNLSNRELNFFQRTILEILYFKKFDSSELSDMLLLNKDLISYIIDELRELGYYHNGLVTNIGKNALKNTYESNETIVGYFIYDLLSKRFLDYFIIEDLLSSFEIDFFYNKNNNSLYLRPSINEDDYVVDIIDSFTSSDNIAPSKESISNAYKNYIKQYKRELSNQNYSMYDSEIIEYKIRTDQIQIFNNPIQNYYLCTYAYNNKSNINKGFVVNHSFFDSFDISLTNFFKNNISNSSISKIFNKVSDAITSRKDKEEANNERYASIRTYLEEIFKDNFLTAHKDFVDAVLVNLCDNYFALDIQSKLSYDVNQVCSNFIISLFDAFEFMFSYAVRDKKSASVKLNTDKSYNVQILLDIALKIGFTNKDYISYFLANIHRDKLYAKKNNFKKDIQDLPTLMAINLLVANDDLEFPFYKVSKGFDNLFSFLYDLRNMRNSTTHDGTYSFKIDNIKSYFDYFLGILSVMFNVEINFKKLFSFKPNKDNIETIREEADIIVMNKLDNNNRIKSNEYSGLYDSLITMQIYFDTNNSVSKIIAKIFEQLLKIMLKSFKSDDAISFVLNLGNDAQDFSFIDGIDDYLLEMGFILEDGFPSWLKKRWKKRDSYLNKKTQDKYLFSDLLMFLIIFAIKEKKGDELLRNIASLEPKFITYLIRYGNRQHNDLINNEMVYNYENYKQSVEHTYLCVKTIINNKN